MNVGTIAGISAGAGLAIAVGARLGLDEHFDSKRTPVIDARATAQHRLDTETLDPATRRELQATLETEVPWTLSPMIAIVAGVTGVVGFGFGLSMAEMGGGFATGWAKPNAVTGGLTAGLVGGLLLATLIDRD